MTINWFPGHMTKALRMIEENVNLIDFVCYCLDSRAPYSCVNPSLNKLLNNKPIIYILNKCDLADAKKLNLWKKYFATGNNKSIMLNATDSGSCKAVLNVIDTVNKENVNRFAARGIIRPTRLMVIGVPNSGKSTIINMLSGRKSAVTGNKPGVTRGKQWVRLSQGIELLDTPGTLWPNLENQTLAQNLAFIGSINDDVIDINEIAILLIGRLLQLYPNNLIKKYNLEITETNPQLIFNQICVKRGFIIKGGEIDVLRGSYAIIDDFRKGKIGKMTLEIPNVNA